MRRRRWWRRLGFLAAALALAWGLFLSVEAWRARRALGWAQAELTRGRYEPARQRLASLAAAKPGALGGAVDYWLGICESASGRPEDALRAFARLPEGFAFDPLGAVFEARANFHLGRFRAAEQRLEAIRARDGPGLEGVDALLIRIYELQARFEDVKAVRREGLAVANDPISVLKELSNIDLGRVAHDGLRSALEEYGKLAPEDDRVWLGQANLAILSGRWEEAAGWLRRCREDGLADAPVWKAWLDWAQGVGRPDDALRALRHLEAEDLDPAKRLEVRAWLYQQWGDSRAERQALEPWLAVEPAETRALERLTELAQQAGQFDQVAELRRRKAEVDQALVRYRQLLWSDDRLHEAATRFELAGLAETTGRRDEARTLYALALEADPGLHSAREALARLERAEAEHRRAALAADAPWPERAPTARRKPAGREPAPIAAMPFFTDEAETVGLHFTYENGETPIRQLPEQSGGGVALLDYDGDGWLDVYVVQGGPFPPDPDRPPPGDRLFRNRGDGTFEDVTESSGIAALPRGYGHGVTVADYDNDGWPDLFITRWRSYALYRNNGDGTFRDVTEEAGLGGDRDWPTSAAFADLDGDGWLDLYVCHYLVWDERNPSLCRNPDTNAYIACNPIDFEARPDRLFRNDGGRFVEVTDQAGIVDRDGRGFGVVAADFDDDGLIDLYVANDLTANFLFRNLGGMRFEEVGHLAGVAGNAGGGYQAGMGVAAGDLDGDGLLDLAVTNFYGESTTYYRNLGGGIFTDATAAVGLAVASRNLLGFGIAFFDANNDGWLDLATVNGHVNDIRPNYPYFMPSQLLLGGPDGRLTDVSALAGDPWLVPRMGRGLAVGDLDNDGRLDVLILGHNEPLAYLRNQTDGGRFLVLRLEGDGLNRDAIGAKVTVLAGDRRLVAQRTGGGSFQSASDPRLHFGLGEALRVDHLEVVWPSGRVEYHKDLPTNAAYLLREGQDHPENLPGYFVVDSSAAR